MRRNADVCMKELAALVFPPAASIVRLTLRAFGTASNICAKVSQVLGYWGPRTTGIGDERNESDTSGPGLESDGTGAVQIKVVWNDCYKAFKKVAEKVQMCEEVMGKGAANTGRHTAVIR